MCLNKVEALRSKCAFSVFKVLPLTLNTKKLILQSFTKDISNKEKLWDYAKHFPLNGIRRSLKLNFPLNKSNVTEDMVFKIH